MLIMAKYHPLSDVFYIYIFRTMVGAWITHKAPSSILLRCPRVSVGELNQ